MMRYDAEANSRAVFAVDNDISEVRDASDLYPYRRQKSTRNGNRLHGLIHGTSTDGLNLDGNSVLDHTRYGARNRGRR